MISSQILWGNACICLAFSLLSSITPPALSSHTATTPRYTAAGGGRRGARANPRPRDRGTEAGCGGRATARLPCPATSRRQSPTDAVTRRASGPLIELLSD